MNPMHPISSTVSSSRREQLSISLIQHKDDSKMHCLAKALYDNVAESPDELAFRKGDILTVLEQNPGGLEGWWLCSLRGRQGVGPGNRLRLMPGLFDPSGLGYAGSSSPCDSTSSLNMKGSKSGTPPLAPSIIGSRRRSWHINPNRVITPQKVGAIYLYDIPLGSVAKSTEYDIPVSARQPRSSNSSPLPLANHHLNHYHSHHHLLPTSRPKSPDSSYDTPPSCPRALRPRASLVMNGRSSSSELLNYDGESGRKTRPDIEAYDIPPCAVRPVGGDEGDAGNYDVPMPPVKILSEGTSSPGPAGGPGPGQPQEPFQAHQSLASQLSSSSSSLLSPHSNRSSLDASLSLSSYGAGSNRSSLERSSNELYDIPPVGEPRKVPATDSPTPTNETKRFLPPHLPPYLPLSSRKSGSSTSLESLGAIGSRQGHPQGHGHANGHANGETHIISNGDLYAIPGSKVSKASLSDEAYDIPKAVIMRRSDSSQSNGSQREGYRLSVASTASEDSMTYASIPNDLPLNVDLNTAIVMLVKVQQAVQSAIEELFTFITDPKWRSRDVLESRLVPLKNCCHRLRSSLQDFFDFGQRVLVNATKVTDGSLSTKLVKLLNQMANSNAIIFTTTTSLDSKGWDLERLAIDSGGDQRTLENRTPPTPDELDQMVACCRGLTEDAKHIFSFIQGNGKLLFRKPAAPEPAGSGGKKPPLAPKPAHLRGMPSLPPPAPPVGGGLQARPLPPVPVSQPISVPKQTDPNSERNPSPESFNDYDYVSLESKEMVKRENEEIKAALPQEMRKSFENLVKASEVPVESNESLMKSCNGSGHTVNNNNTNNNKGKNREEYGRLCDATSLEKKDHSRDREGVEKEVRSGVSIRDKQVLHFYAPQLETHQKYLSSAIDAFIHTMNSNQPPKVFIGHSKFVVIAAQKLIYIGDTVQRNVSHCEVRGQVDKSVNCLHDSLKALVANTKKAVTQFPSVSAVQEMVDSIVDVSHYADQLKVVVIKATTC